jgi:EspG family
MWDELSAHGLAGPRGLSDHFREALHLLTHGQTEFYGWTANNGAHGTVLVAVRGQHAIRATRRDGIVELAPVSAEGPAEALVALLPPQGPGRGESMSAPADELARFKATGSTSHPATRRFATRYAELIKTEPLGAGELHVAVRNDMGRRTESRYPLSYLDTPGGRWFVQAGGRAPEIWMTASPAGPAVLATKLYEMRRMIM